MSVCLLRCDGCKKFFFNRLMLKVKDKYFCQKCCKRVADEDILLSEVL